MQIGATFSQSANLEPINLQITAAQLQQALPKQKFAFDDALNRLQYEIVRASRLLPGSEALLIRDVESCTVCAPS
jgi:hypothetical protein